MSHQPLKFHIMATIALVQQLNPTKLSYPSTSSTLNPRATVALNYIPRNCMEKRAQQSQPSKHGDGEKSQRLKSQGKEM